MSLADVEQMNIHEHTHMQMAINIYMCAYMFLGSFVSHADVERVSMHEHIHMQMGINIYMCA